jgi:hypothetical protein
MSQPARSKTESLLKTYSCICGQLIFFENVFCVACNRDLGFLPDLLCLSGIEAAPDGLFQAAGNVAPGYLYKKCRNYAQSAVCNWMIPASDEDEPYCQSCRLNLVIPDLNSDRNRQLWALMEKAKRRLIYSLTNLKLPLASKSQDSQKGLGFRFLSDVINQDGSVRRILTGHESGTVTLNIAEADDAIREKARLSMKEPYRTLLGHFRHEIGHYYWERLVQGTKFLNRYRAIFGNEQWDYGYALSEYYAHGAPANWQANYISAYATSHPWEDWAESWAHFMHMQDTLEVAGSFGIAGKPIHPTFRPEFHRVRPPSGMENFDGMITAWSELAVALNSINRSMGHQDLYPFVLSPAVIDKLRFVFEIIADRNADPVRGA